MNKAKKKRKNSFGSPSVSPGIGDASIVEINVGGKIFATTIQTMTNQGSLFTNFQAKCDSQGRVFVDRDGTHFRWILNYLRDGTLITVPSRVCDRLELLQEARYYQLAGLVNVLEAQPGCHPQVIANAVAQAMAAIQQTNQAAASAASTTPAEKPSFLTARPSTKGIFFFLTDVKWRSFFPKQNFHTVAVRFEEGREEVMFLSLHIDESSGNILKREDICQAKLHISPIAKATIEIMDGEATAEAEFWWEPSQSQYPQLWGKLYREKIEETGPMDFYRTSQE